jgi:dUTP pyrophosphatase
MSEEKVIEIPNFRFALNEGLDSSFLPTRGSERATGWDVRSTQTIVINAGEYVKIDLGFRTLAPNGWWLELRPRSSSFAKKNLHTLYGVIDEDYEGKMVFACQFSPNPKDVIPGTNLSLSILKGEALGQLIPVRRQEMTVEQVSNEEFDLLCKARGLARGAGGFGSTSK